MKTDRLTPEDFRNAGHSRPESKAADPSQNWKAANGGKRAPLDLSPRQTEPPQVVKRKKCLYLRNDRAVPELLTRAEAATMLRRWMIFRRDYPIRRRRFANIRIYEVGNARLATPTPRS